MQVYLDRIVRAAKLDVNLYEEVEADKGAMSQAMGVVVLSSVAAGIGSIGPIGTKGVIIGAITALIAWYILSVLKSFLNLRPKPIMVNYYEPSDFQALQGCLGYWLLYLE